MIETGDSRAMAAGDTVARGVQVIGLGSNLTGTPIHEQLYPFGGTDPIQAFVSEINGVSLGDGGAGGGGGEGKHPGGMAGAGTVVLWVLGSMEYWHDHTASCPGWRLDMFGTPVLAAKRDGQTVSVR
jgi:hypothetical protein